MQNTFHCVAYISVQRRSIYVGKVNIVTLQLQRLETEVGGVPTLHYADSNVYYYSQSELCAASFPYYPKSCMLNVSEEKLNPDELM